MSGTRKSTRKSPCVGICSTTYGDLVCRGCKRFAHEITNWNGYDEDQRSRIWTRLLELREQVMSQTVSIVDQQVWAQYTASFEGMDTYECLAHLIAADKPMSAAGLVAPSMPAAEPLKVIQAVDAEIYQRSIAHYEHSFRVTG